MAILRSEDFENFLKRKSASLNGLLLHGNDADEISVLARQVMRHIAGDAGIQSAVLHVDASELKTKPGLIEDEFKSMSLLGERRIIFFEGVDDNCLKFVESVLADQKLGNFVLLQGGNLSKSSKLRSACEAASLFASLAVYEEDVSALALRLSKLLQAEGLSWNKEAEAVFLERVGTERGAVNQELKKLIVYCHGQNEITEADVIAICGDMASFASDEVIDAVLRGDMSSVDAMSSGVEGDLKTVLILFLNYLVRLQQLRSELDNGVPLESLVRSAKPPIFFKRQAATKSQLRTFDLERLMAMQEAVATAIFQTRKSAELADAITNRTLLSMARNVAVKLN